MTEAALLNHLWQSTVFAAAAAGLAFALRGHQARVRFWIWTAASLKFLVPFAALAELGRLAPWPRAALAPAPMLAAASAPFGSGAATLTYTYSPPLAAGQPLFFWLLLASGAGSALLLARWAVRWARLARIARAAVPERREGMAVLSTAAMVEPGVFGILRPVLLLPRGIEARLSPEQLRAVLSHESCHLRRRDNLWSALHMAVETVFWFHPLVWWMGARLVAEREHACDEEVLRRGGDREAYASGIVAVCRFYAESPLACAAGVTGGELTQRVGEIMRGHWGHNLSRGKKALLCGLGAAALAGPLGAGIIFGQAPAPQHFDAASITAAKMPAGRNIVMTMGLRTLPTRLVAQNMTLKDLLVAAYGLKPYQVEGPDWISSERFNVNAEVSEPLPEAEMDHLLVPFLQQQFQLVTHKETKVMPVYTLTVDKGGAKLTPADPAVAGALGDKPGRFMMSMNPKKGAELKGTSDIAGLANMISRQMDRPVLDKTGLTGTYAYTLDYTPDFHGRGGMMLAPRMKAGGAPPSPGDDSVAPAPTLLAAVQEQLGLKLEAGKGPIEILVVDQANKVPVGN